MNKAIAYRKYNEPNILSVRPLVTADIAHLRTGRTAIDPIKTIRDRHHHIAWLIALGKSHVDICAEVNITPSRISVYLKDPTFLELVEKRRAEVNEIRREHTQGFIAAATENMIDGEKLISRQFKAALEDSDGESTPALRDINRIVADRMDRFGYGKHSTSENRNINVDFAVKLERAIERSRKTIEAS